MTLYIYTHTHTHTDIYIYIYVYIYNINVDFENILNSVHFSYKRLFADQLPLLRIFVNLSNPPETYGHSILN